MATRTHQRLLARQARQRQPAGGLGIGAAAFLPSYDALHSLALASGVRPGLAHIWPGVLDGFIRLHRSGHRRGAFLLRPAVLNSHPHEDLIRRGYEAFVKGDMETLRELFDPGIVWHFPGRSVLAGDHRGVDAVLGFFGRTVELTAGTFRVEVHEVVADDQHTVGLHLATGQREGRTLEDREVLVCHVRDGKVVEVWQYVQDQYTYDEFFS